MKDRYLILRNLLAKGGSIVSHNIRKTRAFFGHNISRRGEYPFRFYAGPGTQRRASLRSSSLLGRLSVQSNFFCFVTAFRRYSDCWNFCFVYHLLSRHQSSKLKKCFAQCCPKKQIINNTCICHASQALLTRDPDPFSTLESLKLLRPRWTWPNSWLAGPKKNQ